MGLLLAILPIALVTVVGGAIVIWAIFADEPGEAESGERRAAEALEQLTAKPLVLFEPMVWSAELRRLPVEELVAKLEQELVARRQEAEAYADSLSRHTPDPS